MMKEHGQMELARLTTGDIAYRYDKSIALIFGGRRKVLSTLRGPLKTKTMLLS